jgi:hypothetical protein
VTHADLGVDGFYVKNNFQKIEEESKILEFLERKGKQKARNEYI